LVVAVLKNYNENIFFCVYIIIVSFYTLKTFNDSTVQRMVLNKAKDEAVQ